MPPAPDAGEEVVLRLTGVDTFYGPIHALRGVSLSVRQGQVVALLGANGAGKSTTLRTISGLAPCRAGRIEFLGQDITRVAAHAAPHLGLVHVPEGRRIFKGMTVRENLELGSFTLSDEAERRRRMEHVFALFPLLRERKGRDAAYLSGGEQQMLAIGRALMSQPKVVLLDEPSLGLAPMLVEEIFGIVSRLVKQEKLSVLLVEQNATMALTVADHGYVMENGRIVLEGPAAKLRDNSDIKEFYLGLNEGGARKSYHDTKHYKRRKRWLS